MMERGTRRCNDLKRSWTALYRIGCHAKRHQKAIASEQEQRIPPGASESKEVRGVQVLRVQRHVYGGRGEQTGREDVTTKL